MSTRTANAVALLKESPETLDGFLKLSQTFESTTLDPHSRETVILTVADRNQCHLCVDMHEAKMAALGPAPTPNASPPSACSPSGSSPPRAR